MNFKRILRKLTPHFLLNLYHWLWAFLGAAIYGFPSSKLIVIGVTGTSGKSTTIDFICRILEEAGHKVASTSSIRFKVAEKEWKNNMKMTMPGRFVIQKVLKEAVDAGCKYAVVEVTSEGIKQFRHKFINFHTAVFLNLTPEHIESHGSFENYRAAKLELFKATKHLHIINADDENAKHFVNVPAKEKYLFGIKNNLADLRAENIEISESGVGFKLQASSFKLHVLGDFNVLNALAAISVGISQNISLDVCRSALAKVTGMPGRLEVVVPISSRILDGKAIGTKGLPMVVVDYAFTKEQLEASYKSLNSRPLVCVLGACGGGRDKWKRPILGKVASQYCKEVIITDEDPYDEDPLEIMQQVAEGVGEKPHSIVLDRKEAIKKALELAEPTDTVIITGKGAEPLMCLADGKKIPWDDRQIVRDILGN